MTIAAIGAIAAIVSAISVVVSTIIGVKGRNIVTAKVDAVHTEVKTANGITLAALADRTEGRRIEADILPADRTVAEDAYVEHLSDPH